MAGITREYNFITGPETATLPTPGTPTAAADTVTKGFADLTYVQVIPLISTLKAVSASNRYNNQYVYLNELQAFFYFNSSGVATANDQTVIAPTSGSGRWQIATTGISAPIANGQASPTSIAPLYFDTAVKSAIIDVFIRRVSTGGGATEVITRGLYFVTYNATLTTWTLTPFGFGGDETGVVLSITGAGQVQYTSDTMAGTYDTTNSKITFSTKVAL